MTESEGARYEHAELQGFSRSVLEKAGLSEDHAALLADLLVTANLRGVDTHGVTKLEIYVENIVNGGFNPAPNVRVSRTRNATVRIDADDGPGHVAAQEGMTTLIEVAKEQGAGFGTIQNGNHIGMLAYYTMQAAEKGCIGMAMTNTLSLVAPFGGVDPVFGTNPIAVSIPTPREYDVTLDMATSNSAMNKIALAAKNGEEIPDDWAIDADGNPVTDPEDVHALLPAGGHKGYGLALLVDVFAGVLSGMGPSLAANPLGDHETPQKTGQFLGVIDVAAFVEPDLFAASMDDLITSLKSTPTQPGFDEVMLPGEIEANVRADREKNGVPVSPNVVENLDQLARRVGVEPLSE